MLGEARARVRGGARARGGRRGSPPRVYSGARRGARVGRAPSRRATFFRQRLSSRGVQLQSNTVLCGAVQGVGNRGAQKNLASAAPGLRQTS